MRRDDQRQAVKNISLEQLKSFKNHPFQVRDDEEFRRLVESIEIHGVIHPAVARQIGEDCYELISGHRRKAACELLGYSEMPVLVRSMTDDEAVVNMVDANLQRETILPSERAFAYKMKLVAMSHQGRKGFTSAQLGRKLYQPSCLLPLAFLLHQVSSYKQMPFHLEESLLVGCSRPPSK